MNKFNQFNNLSNVLDSALESVDSKKVTKVTYCSFKTGQKFVVALKGWLTGSQVERDMLFTRHVPRRLILGAEKTWR